MTSLNAPTKRMLAIRKRLLAGLPLEDAPDARVAPSRITANTARRPDGETRGE